MQVNQASYEYSKTAVKMSYQSAAIESMQDKSKDKDQKTELSINDLLPQEDKYVPSGTAPEELSEVDRMKANLNSAQQKLYDMVNDILKKQGMEVQLGEGFWRTLAKGDVKVDAETRAAAQEAISEDGEWGVKKTSQRLVDFAKALTNGDKSKVGIMRDAFIKGYQAAEKAWGSALPDISKQTYDATMKLFDEWEKGDEAAAETEKTPVEEKAAEGALAM